MTLEFLPMQASDYDEVMALWRATEGVGLNESDSRESIEAYLKRNPGLSMVARQEGRLVGAVLCGHDGRRGSLNHLAVETTCRRHGIGTKLVDACLARLAGLGITRCNILVFAGNATGERFWTESGWYERGNLRPFQKRTDYHSGNASPAK